MSEPRVVVTHREHLWWLLAEALQLEHMIMCQYLFAEFSLEHGVDDGLTPVQADLLPFGEQALDHFLFLERPEGMEREDAAEFVPTAAPREPVDEHETLPRGQEFATVGHLYRGIADGLRALASRFGEGALFVGSRLRAAVAGRRRGRRPTPGAPPASRSRCTT